MPSFMHSALLSKNPSDTTVVLSGPLSEQFTQALNASFSKDAEDDELPENQGEQEAIKAMTTESMQISVDQMQKDVAAGIVPLTPPTQTLNVYAVDENDVSDADVVAFTKLATAVKNPSDATLIVNTSHEEAQVIGNEHIDGLLGADVKKDNANYNALVISGVAKSFGIRRYASLEDFKTAFLS